MLQHEQQIEIGAFMTGNAPDMISLAQLQILADIRCCDGLHARPMQAVKRLELYNSVKQAADHDGMTEQTPIARIVKGHTYSLGKGSNIASVLSQWPPREWIQPPGVLLNHSTYKTQAGA